MKTAILGGIFDPVHNEHLHIARMARDQYRCKVVFVPSFLPPHKQMPAASAKDRVEMLKLALADTGFRISLCEIVRGGNSYTIDTVRELKPDHVICGEDAYQDIDTWKEAELLKKSVHFIVIPRIIDLSSTAIRQRIKQDRPITDLVPDKVEQYIKLNGLYK
ncbi:MAG: nicotinate-nucleotide adenylyltransferase [Candidatus Margulisiibacteriota bacterium]|jgi:nicotinate-nucleotide adenylyltransferase